MVDISFLSGGKIPSHKKWVYHSFNKKKKVVDGFLEHISSNRRGPHALLERDYYISMYLLEQIHTSDKENTS